MNMLSKSKKALESKNSLESKNFLINFLIKKK